MASLSVVLTGFAILVFGVVLSKLVVDYVSGKNTPGVVKATYAPTNHEDLGQQAGKTPSKLLSELSDAHLTCLDMFMFDTKPGNRIVEIV